MTCLGRNEDYAVAGFRIEADVVLANEWLPEDAFSRLYSDHAMAAAMAVEGVHDPATEGVRVVDVATTDLAWRFTVEACE